MSVKQNIAANFAGSAWVGLMGFAFVPFYLRYIGAEGYGLVGFFAMISGILAILDGGFGVAAARELAKSTHVGDQSIQQTRALIRTLEWIFWAIALLLGTIFVALAPWIAEHWLHVQTIKVDVATDALRLMGGALILQWPTALYSGCIIGLQRQVGLNAINSILASIKGLGAMLILWLVSPTIHAFFVWQMASALINAYILRNYLWRSMPEGILPPQFDFNSLRRIGRFAAGVGGINILALVLTQIDKVIVSRVFPLDQFGYYTLAATLAALIYRLIGPVFNAFYPRLTQLVAKGDLGEVALFYHRACQVMALSIVPFSLLFVFFGHEMVMVWTGNAQLAGRIQWIVACLALGTMFNGLMTIPYALQLANGWTSFAFWQNVAAVLLLAPLTYFLAMKYGPVGAAAVWPMLNGCYIMLGGPLMYRKLLSAEMWHWYKYSVGIPIAATACLMGVAKVSMALIAAKGAMLPAVLAASCAFMLSFVMSVLLMPEIRERALSFLRYKIFGASVTS